MPYVVEATEDGSLRLNCQRLLAENAAQFEAKLKTEFIALLPTLSELAPAKVASMAKAGTASAKLAFAIAYVEKRLRFVLEHARKHDLPLYLPARDGYPAGQRLSFAETPLDLRLSLQKNEQGLVYALQLLEAGKPFDLIAEPVELLTEEPVWLLKDSRLFILDKDFPGKKLRPFLSKESLQIPKAQEAAFMDKFGAALLENYAVELDGFDVKDLKTPPVFQLTIQKQENGFSTVSARASYGDYALSLNPESTVKIQSGKGNAVVRIFREQPKEAEFTAVLRQVATVLAEQGVYTAPELEISRALARNKNELSRLEVEVLAETENGGVLAVAEPQLNWRVSELKDGYLLEGEVLVGQQSYSLSDLRAWLKAPEAVVQLSPDTAAAIPPEWREKALPLLEAAQPLLTGWKLDRFHAPLLQDVFELGAAGDAAAPVDFSEAEETPLPAGLNAELRDYQKHGYDWLMFLQRYKLGGILADEMGLGKTIQTIAALLKGKEDGARAPSLVVAPSSLTFNWAEEINRFAPSLKTLQYVGQRRKKYAQRLMDYDVVLTTYGVARQDAGLLAGFAFHYIVLDESHYIKNRNAKTTRAIFQLQSDFRLSLSGAPVENGAQDVWTQMRFLNPGLLGSYAFFEKFYEKPIAQQGNEARKEKLAKLTRPLVLRRTKEMVASELPPSTEQVIYCEMTAAQKKRYKYALKDCRASLFEEAEAQATEGGGRLQIFAWLQQLRQIAIDPRLVKPEDAPSGKYAALLERLETVLAEGGKVLVFSQFVKFLTLLRRDLEKRGLPHCYLDGATTDRKGEVRRFQNDPARQVFLISLKAGGAGLNLTAAQYVFVADPWWNPQAEKQAVGRAHRIGQERPVFTTKFITRGSIEEKILRLQEEKLRLAGDLLPDEKDFFKSISKEDLAHLLRN